MNKSMTFIRTKNNLSNVGVRSTFLKIFHQNFFIFMLTINCLIGAGNAKYSKYDLNNDTILSTQYSDIKIIKRLITNCNKVQKDGFWLEDSDGYHDESHPPLNGTVIYDRPLSSCEQSVLQTTTRHLVSQLFTSITTNAESMDSISTCSEVEIGRSEETEISHLNISKTHPQVPNLYQNLPPGTNINPFDHTTSKWMSGIEIARTTTPIPDTIYPSLAVPETSKMATTTFKVISINIPWTFFRTSADILFSVEQYYKDFDFICLSELYVNPEFLNKLPSNYIIFTGGTDPISCMILVKKHLKRHVSYLEKNLNFCSIKISTGPKKSQYVKLHCGYRSPGCMSTKFLNSVNLTESEYIDNLGSFFYDQTTRSITVGDLNFNLSPDNDRTPRIYEKRMTDIIKNCPLKNHIGNNFTHFSTRGTTTTTDVLLSTLCSRVMNVKIDTSNSIFFSDHCPINFEIPHVFEKKMDKIVSTRGRIFETEISDPTNPYTLKYIKLQKQFENLELITPKFDDENNRDTALKVEESLIKAVDSVMPIKNVQQKSGDSIHKLSGTFYSAKLEMDTFYKVGGKAVIKSERYLQLKKICRTERHKCIRNAIISKASVRTLQQKKQWAILQSFEEVRVDIPDSLCANQFAKRFQALSFEYISKHVPNPSSNIFEELKKRQNSPDEFFEFDLPLKPGCRRAHLDILTVLNDPRGSKHASSHNGISREFLRMLPNNMINLLSMVISICMYTGEYPEGFREMRGMPIFKKGDRSDIKNYRPILICSQIANCAEKLFSRQLLRYCEIKKIFHSNQGGFLPGRSIGALINWIRRMHLLRSIKEKSLIILTDLSNAFGSTDSDLIIESLKKYLGIRPLIFLRSFLSQCRVTVECHGKSSEKFLTAPRGYAQGSCSSPQLFLMLMSKSHDGIFGNQSHSYADDDNISVFSESWSGLEDKGQLATSEFVEFCEGLNIKCNPTKTHFVTVKRHKNGDAEKPEKITINALGTTLEEKNEFDILGVKLDRALQFGPACDNMIKKMKFKSSIIYRHARNMTKNFIVITIKSFIMGSCLHGLQYFGTLPPNFCKVINCEIRKILKLKFYTADERAEEKISHKQINQQVLFARAGISSFQNTVRIVKLCRMNKILQNAWPIKEFEMICECLENPISNRLRSNSQIPNRMRENHYIPIFHNNPKIYAGKPADFFTTQPFDWFKIFNKLPPAIQSNLGTPKFDHQVKHFFTTICQHPEHSPGICSTCNENVQDYELLKISNEHMECLLDKGKHILNNANTISKKKYSNLIFFESMTNEFFNKILNLKGPFHTYISNMTNWFNHSEKKTFWKEPFSPIGTIIDSKIR